MQEKCSRLSCTLFVKQGRVCHFGCSPSILTVNRQHGAHSIYTKVTFISTLFTPTPSRLLAFAPLLLPMFRHRGQGDAFHFLNLAKDPVSVLLRHLQALPYLVQDVVIQSGGPIHPHAPL